MDKSSPGKISGTRGALMGAAFLMATSAIGPGFLTQTTVFTYELAASFGFVILVSVLLDIGAQLNTWRIIAVSEKKAQDIANMILPGLGHFLALLIVLGGLAFNIGNIAGCGLGMNVLFGLPAVWGAALSGVFAVAVFLVKEAGIIMDRITLSLGILMICLTLFVAFSSSPPLGEALERSFFPERISIEAIVTLVGGTVGGYIMFAGAHRLLDAGIRGQDQLAQVSKSSVSAIGLASLMRILLFLASLGIVMQGLPVDPGNPPASVFRHAAGKTGYLLFGVIMWSAAITSVIGSAYTSVSFIRSLNRKIELNAKWVIVFFILVSTTIFILIGKPVKVLILVGALNGLILPVSLGVMLVAAHKRNIVGIYKHPVWMTVFGIFVVCLMAWMGMQVIMKVMGDVF